MKSSYSLPGKFRATDGRPHDVPHWFIDADLAAQIIAEFEARANRTVVDYEHQTLLAAQNGQPAPAAGWFGKLEWRESGLYDGVNLASMQSMWNGRNAPPK